jgi:hypothetical protein
VEDLRSQGKIFFYGPAGAVGGMVELCRYLEAQLIVISRLLPLRAGSGACTGAMAQLIPARRGRPS